MPRNKNPTSRWGCLAGHGDATARLAPPGVTGSYFGFSAISLGVGGALGNVLGGTLTDAGARLGLPLLPWLTLMAVGGVTALGLRWALREAPAHPAEGARAQGGSG